jgi:hypothetical protein
VSGHHLFFSGEVSFGVKQEVVENLAECIFALAGLHGLVELIQEADEFLVLLIDLGDSDTHFAAPIEESHDVQSP